MAKKTLTITKFDGGLNCFSDARDIKNTEFFQNWNAVVDKAGVIRVSGEGHRYIRNLPHTQTYTGNMQPGYGLYSFSADYTINELSSTKGLEEGTVSVQGDDIGTGGSDGTDVSKFITLATSPTNVSLSNYNDDDFFNQHSVVFYTGAEGNTANWVFVGCRYIIDYVYNASDNPVTHKIKINKTISVTTSTKYIIFPWMADSVFGDSIDLKDGATSGPYLTAASYDEDDEDVTTQAHGLAAINESSSELLYLASGATITGLVDGHAYFSRRVDNEKFSLWNKAESAVQGTPTSDRLNLDDDGASSVTSAKFYFNASKSRSSFGIRNFIAGDSTNSTNYATTTSSLSKTETFLYLVNGDAKSINLIVGSLVRVNHDDDSTLENSEIMLVTAITYGSSNNPDKLTIDRGKENTNPSVHSSTAKLFRINSYGYSHDRNDNIFFKTKTDDIFSGQGLYLGRLTYGTSAGINEVLSNASTSMSSGGKWAASNDFSLADVSGIAGGITYSHGAGSGTAGEDSYVSQISNNRTDSGKATSINGVLCRAVYYMTAVHNNVSSLKILGGYGEFAANDNHVNLPVRPGHHQVYFTSRPDNGYYSTGIQSTATYSSGHTAAIVVDGVSATSSIGSSLILNVGDTIYANSSNTSTAPTSIGVITAIGSSTSITVGGGTSATLTNNNYIYVKDSAATNNFTISATSDSTGKFRILFFKIKACGNSGLTLVPGRIYTLKFWAKCKRQYMNTVSDVHKASETNTTFNVSHADRLPHVLLYNDEVTDGTDTGLYLQSSRDMPTWSRGQNSKHEYLSPIPENMNKINNGDFSNGSISGGNSFSAAAGWSVGGNSGSFQNATLTFITNAAGAEGKEHVFNSSAGAGNTLKMEASGDFEFDSDGLPSGYIYQDIVLKDDTHYIFSFAYGSEKGSIAYSIEDRTDTSNITYLTYGSSTTDSNKRFRTLGKTGLEDGDLIKYKYPSGDFSSNIFNEDRDEFSYIYFNTADYNGFFRAGTAINNGSGYAAGLNTALTVDTDARTNVSVGDIVYVSSSAHAPNPEELGVVTTVAETALTFAGGIKVAVLDNQHLYLKKSISNIRIAFSPVSSGDDKQVYLDSIVLQKAWPDLLSLSRRSTSYINPYSIAGGWNEYKLQFSVPLSYGNSSAWTLAIDGGMFTYKQNGDGAKTKQSFSIDDINLTSDAGEDIILLTNNTSTSSNIHLYSETSSSWIKNYIDWPGVNSKPVYTHINGAVKISDGNFDNDNPNYNIYYQKTKTHGGFLKEGWVTTDSILPKPPPLRILASGQSAFVSYKFNGRRYIEKLFGDGTYRGGEAAPDKRTNWECDRLGTSGIVLSYVRSYPAEHEGGRDSNDRIQNNEGVEYSQYGIGSADNNITDEDGVFYDNLAQSAPDGDRQPRRNPFYLLIRGNDGTTSDDIDSTGAQVGGYSMQSVLQENDVIDDLDNDAVQIAKIELDMKYELKAAQQLNHTWEGSQWYNQSPPFFKVEVGKVEGVTNDFKTTAITSTMHNSDLIQKLIDNNVDDSNLNWDFDEENFAIDMELYDRGRNDLEFDKHWPRSSWFPKSNFEDPVGDKWIKGSNEFTSTVDLTGLEVSSFDDILIKITTLHDDDGVEDEGTKATYINRLLRYRSFLYWIGEDHHGGFTDDDGNAVSAISKHIELYYTDDTTPDIDADYHLLFHPDFMGNQSVVMHEDDGILFTYGGLADDSAYKSKYQQWDMHERYHEHSDESLGRLGRFAPSKTAVDFYDKYNDDYAGWNFSRWERLIFTRMQVYFYNKDFNQIDDGQTAGDKDSTTVNFNFNVEDEIEPTGWARQSFKVAVTSVNEFGEESYLGISETTLGVDDAEDFNIEEGSSPSVNIFVGTDVFLNEKITKLKYYLKNTNSDVWYLQFYVDLKESKAYATTSNHVVTGTEQVNNECVFYYINRKYMANFNEVDSYESETQVPSKIAENTNIELTCRYKTAVVANDKLYVGNVKFGDRVYGDKMIASPGGNKYNILPITNDFDIAINDGDEITALEYYKDKILQFKKHKVFVFDISDEYKFVSDTFDNVGVRQQCQVARTKHGIVWVNPDGCFLYDGKSLTNLISGKIPSTSDMASISNNYWVIDYSATGRIPTVQYIQDKDTLLIARGTTSFAAFQTSSGFTYNFPTKSWAFLNNKLTGTNTTNQGDMSNMVLNKDGDILYYSTYDNQNDIFKWSDAASVDNEASGNYFSSIYFTTRDFDFGDAAVRKKIYKVYVTYRTADGVDSNVTVFGAINGSGDDDEVAFSTSSKFAGTTTNCYAANGTTSTNTLIETDGVWKTAELKFATSSQVNNIYSFQLFFRSFFYIRESFEINDISIVYRMKNIK